MSVTFQIEVFRQHIEYLTGVILTPFPKEFSSATQILDRSLAFHLISVRLSWQYICNSLQALYKLLPAETIRSRINSTFYNKPDVKGSELTQAVMRAAHTAKTDQVRSTSCASCETP